MQQITFKLSKKQTLAIVTRKPTKLCIPMQPWWCEFRNDEVKLRELFIEAIPELHMKSDSIRTSMQQWTDRLSEKRESWEEENTYKLDPRQARRIQSHSEVLGNFIDSVEVKTIWASLFNRGTQNQSFRYQNDGRYETLQSYCGMPIRDEHRDRFPQFEISVIIASFNGAKDDTLEAWPGGKATWVDKLNEVQAPKVQPPQTKTPLEERMEALRNKQKKQ